MELNRRQLVLGALATPIALIGYNPAYANGGTITGRWVQQERIFFDVESVPAGCVLQMNDGELKWVPWNKMENYHGT